MNKIKCLPGEKAARTGVYFLVSVFPIFITNIYQNITASRYFFFTLTSSFFFLLCLLSAVKAANLNDVYKKIRSKELSKPDLFFALFVLVAVVSTVSSRYKLASVSGGGGRKMGLLLILATFFAYIFISKFYRIRSREFIFFGITVAFSCVFGFIQFLGFDPLDMLDNLKRFDYLRFISFSGNINIHASFICIGAPFAMYMFCSSEKKKETVFWLFVAVCGFIGLLTCNSDSGYLGVFVAFIALAVICSKERAKLIRYFTLIIVFFSVCGAFGIVHGIFGDRARSITFLGKILVNPAVVLASILFSLLVTVLLCKKISDEKYYRIIHKTIIILICFMVVAVISVILYFSIIDTETDIGSLEYYLRFNDRWGTDRGYVWKRMLMVFESFPLYKKLIGSGPDTAVFELMIQHGEDMRNDLSYYFDNAHNDLIQYLVTLGIWGVVTYLGLFFFAAKSGLQSPSVYSRAAAFSTIAFLAQSTVNIYQPITTPLFFVFIALSQCRKYEEAE